MYWSKDPKKCRWMTCNKRVQTPGYCRVHQAEMEPDPDLIGKGPSDLADASGGDEVARICQIKDCTKRHNARGYCGTHYNVARGMKNESPDKAWPSVPEVMRRIQEGPPKCAADGCAESSRTRGYCRDHYSFARRLKTITGRWPGPRDFPGDPGRDPKESLSTLNTAVSRREPLHPSRPRTVVRPSSTPDLMDPTVGSAPPEKARPAPSLVVPTMPCQAPDEPTPGLVVPEVRAPGPPEPPPEPASEIGPAPEPDMTLALTKDPGPTPAPKPDSILDTIQSVVDASATLESASTRYAAAIEAHQRALAGAAQADVDKARVEMDLDQATSEMEQAEQSHRDAHRALDSARLELSQVRLRMRIP